MSLATESGFDASDVSKICAELSAAFTSDPPSTARQNSTEPDAVNGLAPLIYQRAVDMVKADRLGDGIFTLALLLCLPGGKIDGLPGLATCAFRMRRHDAALSLALESLKLEVKHPRACCIAGLCELKRGDRRAAQAYLAAATRIARKLPEHRDDLRIAQRALLFMHLT